MDTIPTPRQFELLANSDWRFHAIGPGGTGLMSIATTETPSKLSKRFWSFSLPSAPALYLSLATDARRRRLSIDLDAAFVNHPPNGRWPDDHKDVFDFFQEFMAEIIFSFTALESFANESIPDGFSYESVGPKKEKTP